MAKYKKGYLLWVYREECISGRCGGGAGGGGDVDGDGVRKQVGPTCTKW